MNKHKVFISISFSLFLIGISALFNFVITPSYIWFYQVAFALLWWPMIEIVRPRSNPFGFALAGSIITALFLGTVNILHTPDHLWSVYALYPLAWWPISISINKRRKLKSLSLVVSIITICYLVATNLLFSPMHPWFLYACYPIIWWPIVMFLNRRAGTIQFANICTFITIAYYTALNILVSPGFPWVICIAFVLLWWPISMHFAKVKKWVVYSLVGGMLVTAFMVILNHVSSPNVTWAIYPIFVVTWWPMTMIFQRKHFWFGYSIAGTLLFSSFIALVNYITSPDVIWAIYPIFAILWWPLSVYFFGYKKKKLSA